MKRYIVTTPDVPHRRSGPALEDYRRHDGAIGDPRFWITTIFWATLAWLLASLKIVCWTLFIMLVWMGIRDDVSQVRVPWTRLAIAAGLVLRVLVEVLDATRRTAWRVGMAAVELARGR